jgi:predicted  nucleic acid-binding Zn-ribbon protein
MTEQRRTNLKELQKLDLRIKEAKQKIGAFDPLLEEVEEPALVLEGDLGTSRTRLQEMKLEEQRLELATEERRDRQKRLEERLGSVRNLREESAVSVELEMVKRALQNDEQEGLTLMDQLRKMDERLADLEAAFAEATELVGPKRDDLLAQRAAVGKELETMQQERDSSVSDIDASEFKVYDAIRGGGRTIAVAPLTHDGACGHCFGMVPLQLRNELAHREGLIRCEGCGVILTAPEDMPPQAEQVAEVAEVVDEAHEADGADEAEGQSELEPAGAGADESRT